ncbi:MAG: NAD-dependent epimerase/dehydratase family protein [Flavobacterium sp.]
MTRIFTTGINGLLGTNLVHDLLENGFRVKGLVRDESKYKGLTHQDLELVEGNLFDDFSSFLEETEVVIHVAAETNPGILDYSGYKKVNCDATMKLFDAAVKCRVKKFIFISTANTLGYGSLINLGSESKEMKSPFDASFYAKSKLEAEKYLLQNNDKIEVVIIHPSFMLGAYDTKPSSGKIILMGWKKKVVFYPPGGKNFVHVKDVSKAIINSLTQGKNSEKYLVVNENLTYSEFFRKLNKETNQNPIMVKVPKPILITAGYLGDMLRFFKVKTSISSLNMKILCINNFYSNEKSRNELGIDYQPIEVAIKDAVNYFSSTKPK